LLKVVLKTKHRSINQSFWNSSDRRGRIFGRSDRSLILGGPIVRQTFCCCFVCNGFAKHVPHHFQQYFSYIMETSFSGGRSRSIRREPSTMGKQLVIFITCSCESSVPFFVILLLKAW
jgi:hypothetical protein